MLRERLQHAWPTDEGHSHARRCETAADEAADGSRAHHQYL